MKSIEKKAQTSKSKSKTISSSSGKRRKKQRSGLSPPKAGKSVKEDAVDTGTPLEFDRTQWEYTRFKDEAEGKVVRDPDEDNAGRVGEATPLIQESKQVMLVRGEHLLKKPIIKLVVLTIELLLVVFLMAMWMSYTHSNELAPIILCMANLVLLVTLILIIIALEFSRCHVRQEFLHDKDYRYRIKYEWKYMMCIAHVFRFFLTTANITMAALDHDYDGGVISLIAVHPIILVFAVGHALYAIRP